MSPRKKWGLLMAKQREERWKVGILKKFNYRFFIHFFLSTLSSMEHLRIFCLLFAFINLSFKFFFPSRGKGTKGKEHAWVVRVYYTREGEVEERDSGSVAPKQAINSAGDDTKAAMQQGRGEGGRGRGRYYVGLSGKVQ